jgi:alkanesulfonate monooxygenase SsuD/methylene tetrahydromethanopterin reductase-like flavin-dependent oxidoreductase (luciferase family)
MISFGLALPHYDGLFPSRAIAGAARTRAALSYAQRAESIGFSEVWASDHLWLELADGKRRYSPDCWTLLSAIAATTDRIRLGSLVSAAPLREPALLAHQVATVVDLAPGRVDLGLGAGWHEPEFAAIGVRFPPVSERLSAVERTAASVRASLGIQAPPIWIGGKRSGWPSPRVSPTAGTSLGTRPPRHTPATDRHCKRRQPRADGIPPCWPVRSG